MTEMTVEFKDIQEALEPIFAGQVIRILVEADGAVKLLPQNLPQKKVLKAGGALKAYADPSKIPLEREAWGKAVVEKYANRDI